MGRCPSAVSQWEQRGRLPDTISCMDSDSSISLSDRFLSDVTQEVRSVVAARLPSVYSELRARADACLRTLPPGQSVAPTELVHEVYLKLSARQSDVDWRSDSHFVAAATIAMRQIAIDRIKARVAQKCGGHQERLSLHECMQGSDDKDERVQLLVDHALTKLEQEHPRCARLVQCRFFLGLSEIEAARAVGVSDRTARRDWVLAKAWLARALTEEGLSPPGKLT